MGKKLSIGASKRVVSTFFFRIATAVRHSFWFVPMLCTLGAIVLAFSLIKLDSHYVVRDGISKQLLFGAGPEGSRVMLSAIAGSMITVAGVVFSITIVVLSLASTQYTPRVLRNFIRDRANQVVLGVFVGIFTYCLIVLRSIHGGEEKHIFIPGISIFVGLVLAVVGVSFVIFFIHHMAVSVQSARILEQITRETLEVITEVFPSGVGTEQPLMDGRVAELIAERRWIPVPARASGYIQTVNGSALLAFAVQHQTIVRMEATLGEFMVADSPLLYLADYKPTEEQISELNDAYYTDTFRTIEQDPRFGVRQIVDVALKALSPGVNDVTTAVECIDQLTQILVRASQVKMPQGNRYHERQLRLCTVPSTFADLMHGAFDEIRRCSTTQVRALEHILVAIRTISAVAISPHHRESLLWHVDAVSKTLRVGDQLDVDEHRANQLIRELRKLLSTPGDITPPVRT